MKLLHFIKSLGGILAFQMNKRRLVSRQEAVRSMDGKTNMNVALEPSIPAVPAETNLPAAGGHGPKAEFLEPNAADTCRILMIELIHLVTLFLTHARHDKGARATFVLFDQIVRRLDILDRMPGHDGGLIVRRITPPSHIVEKKSDYFFLFGNLAFKGEEAFKRMGQSRKSTTHLGGALDQAFKYMNDQGILALYLQLPGKSPERVDQLRLALNIAARFRMAVENNASITFRYFGRALTIPLIRDSKGRPNLNLTLVAGINGLSAVNMREFIKQAAAFYHLSAIRDTPALPDSQYNQLFSVRSIRAQLIQPLLEINNLPWVHFPDPPEDEKGQAGHSSAGGQLDSNSNASGLDIASAETPSADLSPAPCVLAPFSLDPFRYSPAKAKNSIDGRMQVVIDMLTAIDPAGLEAPAFGLHVGKLSRFLQNLEKHAVDPSGMDRLFSLLYERLQRLPEKLLHHIKVQRQGLKIEDGKRTIIVGMVHPRLLDVVALTKERMQTRAKIELVRRIDFDFGKVEKNALVEMFKDQDKQVEDLFGLLQNCFDPQGGFHRPQFIQRIDALRGQESATFELLWCFLRLIPQTQDRLSLLNTMPLFTARLKNRKNALNFLISDLLQMPFQLVVSDRNAFTLANFLLRTMNQEHNSAIQCTPEEVLSVRKSLNETAMRYAAWRLDIDHVRVLSKFDTIREMIRQSLLRPPLSSLPPEVGWPFLFALEREGLIFMALVGSKTARLVLRSALAYYGNPNADIYHGLTRMLYLPKLMSHLQVILRGMGRIGRPGDLEFLKSIEQSGSKFMALDNDPAHARLVKQTMQWVVPAIRSIQAQLHQRNG